MNSPEIPAVLTLFSYPPVMRQRDVETVLDISEHKVRLLRSDGHIEAIASAGRVGYLRWTVARYMGLTDPDVAASEAVRSAYQRETAPVEQAPGTVSVDSSTVVPLQRDEVERASV